MNEDIKLFDILDLATTTTMQFLHAMQERSIEASASTSGVALVSPEYAAEVLRHYISVYETLHNLGALYIDTGSTRVPEPPVVEVSSTSNVISITR